MAERQAKSANHSIQHYKSGSESYGGVYKAATTVSVSQKDISEMTWKEEKKAAEPISRGAVVVHGNTVYFRSDYTGSLYSYQNIPGNEQWSKLPDNPNTLIGLAVIDGLLTGVGGWTHRGTTNTLLSLTGEGERKQWSGIFPPMPTPRSCTSCITTEQALGGYKCNTVEVMYINTKQWTTVCPLPQELWLLSGTVFGDSLYLAGGYIGYSPSKSVLTCSLPDLLHPETLGSSQNTTDTYYVKCMERNHQDSTLASFGGHLLAIGGKDDSRKFTTNDVYRYDSHTDSWHVFSQMKNKRSHCFAFTLPEDKLIIVGGYEHGYHRTDSIEILYK